MINFSYILIIKRIFFYTKIFEYNGEYEELIVEVTNILW